MYYRGGYGNNADLGNKRPRTAEHDPSYYGPPLGYSSPASAPPNPARYPNPLPFPVIRIRGLPFYCTEDDIAGFFYGLDVVDVLMVHRQKRFTGEAYCLFGYPLQVDIALRKDRQSMGSRYVEVFPSDREEYYRAIANEVRDTRLVAALPTPKLTYNDDKKPHVPENKPYDAKKESATHTGILRLRGLPFSAANDDIIEFFKDFKLSENAIHFVMNRDGRASGDAFVEFANAEDAKAAMVHDRKRIGNRYVELYPSTPEDMSKAVSKSQ